MKEKTFEMLRIFMMLCALAFTSAAHAQLRQLNFGGGLQLSALRDRAFSPLLYSGAGYEGFLGYRSTRERREHIWLASAGRANLSNTFNRNLTTTAVRLTNLNLYNISENSNFRAGWSNNNGFHHREIDGFQNFNGRVDFFTTFGPAAKYDLPFSFWENEFRFSAAAHVQLIGIYLPSGYVSSLPSGFGYEPNDFGEAVIESMRVFHPGSSFNAALWPQLDWHLDSGNSISLNYLYEFTRFSVPHVGQRSAGYWFLTFNMTL